jgi:hypothetical protein
MVNNRLLMKNILFFFALLCALGQLPAQNNLEIVTDTAYVQWRTSPDTAWLYIRAITYNDGSSNVSTVRVGDTTAMKTYLINQVLDDQRQYAAAIRTVVNSVGLENRTTLVSSMLETVTGGTNYSQLIALSVGERLMGSYTVSIGSTTFIGTLVRTSSGSVQLRRVENGVTTNYGVSVRSDLSIRINNLPGAPGNTVVAFTGLNSAGRPVYRNAERTVRLQRRDGATFTAQNR